ncbi:MAG: hypothetical protein LRY55_13775 [Leadbetterella sp.]|nr:hypothetical protein [Leadbetterella sp.]
MKKLILTGLAAITLGLTAKAQGTDEPFFHLRKFYTQGNYGTARSQAMGGAFTALGADLSNTYINPAGLGFYNRSEFSGTFNVVGGNNTATYIGQSETTNRSSLDIGQLGVVFSRDGLGSRLKKSNFGISYSTLSNFSNIYAYGGSNNAHSISDSFAELANASGLTPEEIAEDYDKYGNAPDGFSMAVMGGLLFYDEGRYVVNEDALPVSQSGKVTESGNLGQLNISYGANFDDKTYFGAGLGIQTLRFDRATTFDETFPAASSYLRSQYYDNELAISGTGLNLTLGVIRRLNEHLNVGASLTTPTLMWVTDSFIQYGAVDPVTPDAVLYETSAQTALDEFKYRIVSPLRASAGISAFLPKKIGVVSLEAEYVGFSRMGVKDKNSAGWSDGQNGAIQDEYKDVVNLKAGIELRKGIGRLRGGINYINDPLRYASDFNVKKNTVIGSAGIGIRNANFFADLSYSRSISTGAYNPYVLNDESHNSVTFRQTRGTVGITIGSFF